MDESCGASKPRQHHELKEKPYANRREGKNPIHSHFYSLKAAWCPITVLSVYTPEYQAQLGSNRRRVARVHIDQIPCG